MRVNYVFAAMLLIGLGVSLFDPHQFATLLASSDASYTVTLGMQLLLVIGLIWVPLAHFLLTRSIAIIETVRHGDPFVAENAERLRRMAWVFLVLQLIDLVSNAIAAVTSDADHNIEWSFSIAGWFAVLLLFVLAQVFAHGARMRDDLEGTI